MACVDKIVYNLTAPDISPSKVISGHTVYAMFQ